MTEQEPDNGQNTGLGRLAGSWRGTNGFRMMPADDLASAPATATIASAAGGNATVVTYTWTHPDDGAQDGVLLAGSPDDEQAVVVAWADSWHQQPALLSLAGTSTDGRLDVTADYGGGWKWTITIEGDDPLLLTMYNVIPDEHATAEVAAGPYPVMVAELRREA